MNNRPNILLIMSDQHAPRLVGCAGDSLIRTPNLDRLAAGGMRFSNAYCPSPLCVPSRMSFMTGRTPTRNRVWTNEGILSSGIPTWAHAVGTVGYEATLIGRMHVLGPDQRHGFIERLVGERQCRFPGAPELGGPRYTRFPKGTAGQKRAAYYAMIECMDAHIGRILDSLDEAGLAVNTLVVYCSDHGEMLGEHHLWSKKCFYEPSARIPLIARLPGTISPGTVCHSLCSLLDLAPTFVELAVAAPMDTDGESLLPLFRGGGNPERVVTSEVADVNGGAFEWLGKMVRKGDWKLWRHHRTADDASFPPALFNLADDPDETRNLAGNPEHAAIRDELLAHLERDWNPSAVAAEVKRQLRDWRALCQWGKVVQPPHPDTYVWPGEETEADIELVSLQTPGQ